MLVEPARSKVYPSSISTGLIPYVLREDSSLYPWPTLSSKDGAFAALTCFEVKEIKHRRGRRGRTNRA